MEITRVEAIELRLLVFNDYQIYSPFLFIVYERISA
jgi:hypothetical protein